MACTNRTWLKATDLDENHFACASGKIVTQPAFVTCETVVVPTGTSGPVTIPFANSYSVPPSVQETHPSPQRIVLFYLGVTTTGVTVEPSDTLTQDITIRVCGADATAILPAADVIKDSPSVGLDTVIDGQGDSTIVAPPAVDNGDGTATFIDSTGASIIVPLGPASDEQAGVDAIPSGVSTGSVTFPTAFASSPKVNISLQQSGADPMLIAAMSAVSTTGFTYILSDTTASANYSIHWDAQTY